MVDSGQFQTRETLVLKCPPGGHKVDIIPIPYHHLLTADIETVQEEIEEV